MITQLMAFINREREMRRQPCCGQEGLNRGSWSAKEDQMLVYYIKAHGEGNWRSLPDRAGLNRCGKSCRLRWLNYLRPGIKRGNISDDEEDLIIRLHKLLGNRWSLIAGRLPGRTDNEIKNYWKTTLRKKVHGGADQPANPNLNGSMANPSLVRARAEGDAAVVQTKAHRCTKTFFHHPQGQALIPSSTDQQHLELASKEFVSPFKAPHGHSSPLDVPTKAPLRVGEEDEDPCLSMSLDSTHFFDGSWMEDWMHMEDIEFDLTSVASFLDAGKNGLIGA